MKIRVAVIGFQGALRNPGLEECLSGFEISFIEPVKIADGAQGTKWDTEDNAILLGRDLLPGEVGCKLAHLGAYHLDFLDWLLVLEDDALISTDSLKALESLDMKRVGPRPAVIHLFDGGVEQPPRLRRTLYRPSGTVCYLINSRAAKLVRSRKVLTGTADWPLEFKGVRFFKYWGLGIREVSGMSTIHPTSNRAGISGLQYYSRTFKRLFKILARFGSGGLYAAIISPALQDLARKFDR